MGHQSFGKDLPQDLPQFLLRAPRSFIQQRTSVMPNPITVWKKRLLGLHSLLRQMEFVLAANHHSCGIIPLFLTHCSLAVSAQLSQSWSVAHRQTIPATLCPAHLYWRWVSYSSCPTVQCGRSSCRTHPIEQVHSRVKEMYSNNIVNIKLPLYGKYLFNFPYFTLLRSL